MKEMPCIDCITFPICKAQVNEYINSFKKPPVANKFYLAYREILIVKCELIVNWVNIEYNRRGGYNFGNSRYGFIVSQMHKIYRLEF